MTDKERLALFNILGDIEGLKVLDAYAGSGAIGIEALSRGASQVTAIELNPAVAKLIQKNIDKMDLASAHTLVNNRVESYDPPERFFDLIIAAPPFAKIDAGVLNGLIEGLAPKGLMVVSHTSKIEPPELKSLELVQHKVYGDAALSFYKR